MSGESLLVILFVGLVAGWLAGQIVRGTGFGLIGDIVVGIIGAFIGGWLMPRLGIHIGAGMVAAIFAAAGKRVNLVPVLLQQLDQPLRRVGAMSTQEDLLLRRVLTHQYHSVRQKVSGMGI